MKTVNTVELKNHANQLLRRVHGGQPIVVTHHGKPTAALIPLDEDGVEELALEYSPKLRRLIARAAIATGQGQPTVRIQNLTNATTLATINTAWTTTCSTQVTTAAISLTGQKQLACQEFSGVSTEDPLYSFCAIELY